MSRASSSTQITVLESGEGFNKSTAWRVLAGDENFSDESIIGKDSREVQEQLAEIWIHENADLAGMKKAEVETVKAYASRMIDIARPAYGHFVKKQPRHSIEVGTTNSQRVSAVADRQSAVLAAAGSQEHRYRETAAVTGCSCGARPHTIRARAKALCSMKRVGRGRHRAGKAAHQRSVGGRAPRIRNG